MFFAYPNGKNGDFSEKTKAIVKEEGFKAAFTLSNRRYAPGIDQYAVPRINIPPTANTKFLEVLASGLNQFF